jgi:multicomponent Na+:H+ antiporter subunit B
MAAFFGDAFFTGQWLFLGATETEKGLPLSSVLVFDIGVYLVVMGSILTLVFALEEAI